MLQILRMSVAVLGVAAFACGAIQPAEAACQLIKATHSAGSKAEAARSSQALVIKSAAELKRAKRWSYITLYARKVKGDPFWKTVRPDGPPREAVLKPDIVTARFYTTCFTGVVVPYVCTTGTAVCGQ
jgi:Tfp pilus assembly protein PilV